MPLINKQGNIKPYCFRYSDHYPVWETTPNKVNKKTLIFTTWKYAIQLLSRNKNRLVFVTSLGRVNPAFLWNCKSPLSWSRIFLTAQGEHLVLHLLLHDPIRYTRVMLSLTSVYCVWCERIILTVSSSVIMVFISILGPTYTNAQNLNNFYP